jgi:hypothetical protein
MDELMLDITLHQRAFFMVGNRSSGGDSYPLLPRPLELPVTFLTDVTHNVSQLSKIT